jgi:GAF domain
MDQQSIVEQNPRIQREVPRTSATQSSPSIVSAQIAAAKAKQPNSSDTRPYFPGEDNGRSFAALAYRDLDAALQLLAERAQYITGATGAMIALRRDEHNDMLCRASAGSNAPEMGALLSMEAGFSGESVRTRQALRCDDAELDPRVNREGCRQLGIASVVVTPILSDRQVLGVFELFSGKPNAFAERDLSALQRLSEMVETAVKYAVAAQTVSEVQEQAAAEEILSPMDEIKIEVETELDTILDTDDWLATAPVKEVLPAPETMAPLKTESPTTAPEKTAPEQAKPPLPEPAAEQVKAEPKPAAEPAPKKPLFWSAVLHTSDNVSPPADSTPVPAVLRNLHKCQACGFPVSQGRTYCVECEQKQWRGVRVPQVPASAQPMQPSMNRTPEPSSAILVPKANPAIAVEATPKTLTPVPVESSPMAAQISAPSSFDAATLVAANDPAKLEPASASEMPALFLSATLDSESWLAANKYILAVLILVALVVAAIALLR